MTLREAAEIEHYIECGRDCCERCDRIHDACVGGDRTQDNTESIVHAVERMTRAAMNAKAKARS